MPEWRFILADESDGTELIELWQAENRDVLIPLVGGKGAGTVSMTLQLDNPAVDTILGATAADRLRVLLKAYRDDELMFVGDVTTAEEIAEAGNETFGIAAMGPFHTRLGTRHVGITTSGYSDGTVLAQKDLGVILRNMLTTINAASPPGTDTGVRLGTHEASSNGFVGPWHFKKVHEAFVEVSQALAGPDFLLHPVEPVVDGDGLKIAELDTAGYVGDTPAQAIFEYGTGKRNVSGYRRPIDATGMANAVWHLAPGFPDSIEAGVTPIIAGANVATLLTRWREDVVATDLQPNALRQILVNEHTRIRGYPRETIMFTPAPNADVAWGDYGLGDLVEARARIRTRRGISERFDALFRIYGAHFTIDTHGTETTELTLINEAAQV